MYFVSLVFFSPICVFFRLKRADLFQHSSILKSLSNESIDDFGLYKGSVTTEAAYIRVPLIPPSLQAD